MRGSRRRRSRGAPFPSAESWPGSTGPPRTPGAPPSSAPAAFRAAQNVQTFARRLSYVAIRPAHATVGPPSTQSQKVTVTTATAVLSSTELAAAPCARSYIAAKT